MIGKGQNAQKTILGRKKDSDHKIEVNEGLKHFLMQAAPVLMPLHAKQFLLPLRALPV